MKFQRLVTLGLLVSFPIPALAMGSSKPKTVVLTPPPKNEGRVLRKVVQIDSVTAAHIMRERAGGENFEQLLAKQYVTLLLQSKRYSVLAGGAAISLSPSGELQMSEADAVEVAIADECAIPEAQFRLNGNVVSFEVVSKDGFSIGFDPTRGLAGIGAEFSFFSTKASMGLNLQALDPFAQRILASSDVSADQSTTQINAHVRYLELAKLDYEHYKTTPLFQVANRALTLGVNGLNQKLDKLAWSGRLLAQDDRYVLINVGQDAGVKAGDKFFVHDFNRLENPNCRNIPSFAPMALDPRPGAPIASVEVYEVGLTSSWAEIKEVQGTIVPGARLSIEQLVPQPKPSTAAKKKN